MHHAKTLCILVNPFSGIIIYFPRDSTQNPSTSLSHHISLTLMQTKKSQDFSPNFAHWWHDKTTHRRRNIRVFHTALLMLLTFITTTAAVFFHWNPNKRTFCTLIIDASLSVKSQMWGSMLHCDRYTFVDCIHMCIYLKSNNTRKNSIMSKKIRKSPLYYANHTTTQRIFWKGSKKTVDRWYEKEKCVDYFVQKKCRVTGYIT